MNGESEHGIDPEGETLESFFEELGERDEVYGAAIMRVLAWQLEQARLDSHVTKTTMAAMMGTSRTQVDRVLDRRNITVSIGMLARAAHVLGKRLKVELVDGNEVAAM